MTASNNCSPGLYIHIPFCQSKCPYCDFYSLTTPELIAAYLSALDNEAQIYSAQMPANGGTGVSPVPAQAKACGYLDTPFLEFYSLYLGGGTPSLLNGAQLSALVASLRRHFDFALDTEVTLEANPDDVTSEKLACYRDLGVNRLSLGVQSFDEAELRFLGRRHTARQTEAAIELIRAAGFDNLGLDLIYGLPGQTEAAWLQTLKKAVGFRPEHLSCYQLTLEPETPLGEKQARGEIKPLGEEAQAALFLATSLFLEEQGYRHYEISNFARGETYFSRHNRKYWQHAPYLGLGPAAHSFDGRMRWWNCRSVAEYCRQLAEGQAPVGGSEMLTDEQLRLEALSLGFRTREGVGLELVRQYSRWEQVLAELQRAKLVKIQDQRLIPTRQGFLVADRLPLFFVN
jgi:oxygen-independent coproporphyrinogen-3 oxidase